MDIGQFPLGIFNSGLRPLLKWTEGARKHDARVFEALNAELDEDKLVPTTNRLASRHSVLGSQSVQIGRFLRSSQKTEFTFLSSGLNRQRAAFAKELSALDAFIEAHLVMYPVPQDLDDLQLCLEPQYNTDRADDEPTEEQAVRYDALANELDNYAMNVVATYKTYRKAILKQLMI